MEKGRISAGKLGAAAWAAVLAPAVGILPGVTARQAGMGAWLAPLVALPVVLLLVRALGRLNRCGLAESFARLLGKRMGGGLTIIYIMWAIVLGSARLRLCGRRLLFTAQREAELWFVPVVLVVLAVWLACGKTDAFVRAAAVFSRILTLALLVVLGLTVFQIRGENLFPLWTEDILPVLKAVVPVLGVLGYGIYAAFLWDDNRAWACSGRRITGVCGVLLLLQVAVLGNMGAELTAALEDPFLTLSKHVGVEGAFQRMESLVSALWLLGDLALLGLLLWACRRMLGAMAPRCKGWVAAVSGAAAFSAGALLVFRDPLVAQKFEYGPALLGNLILGLGVPVFLAGLDAGKK